MMHFSLGATANHLTCGCDDPSFPSHIVNNARDPVDLKLSDAQSEIFAGWRRPHASGPGDLNPVEHGLGGDETAMAASEDIDLVQDITTDCSVVASLCAGTARARKGHGKVNFFPVVAHQVSF
jgi:hypothetical protein